MLYAARDYDWNGSLQHPIVWGCIFKKDIVQGLQFSNEFFVGEDSLFFAQCLKRSQNLYFVHDTVYHYVHYKESAIHGKFNSKRISEIYAWEEICDLYRKNNFENAVKAALAVRIKLICNKYYADSTFRKHGYLKDMITKYHNIQNIYFRELIKNRKYKELCTGIAFGLWPNLYLRLKQNKEN